MKKEAKCSECGKWSEVKCTEDAWWWKDNGPCPNCGVLICGGHRSESELRDVK